MNLAWNLDCQFALLVSQTWQFVESNTSQYSVATWVKYGEILNNHFIANLLENQPVKEFWDLRLKIKIWQRYHLVLLSSYKTLKSADCNFQEQKAQLSPRDRAMRRVSRNLAICHATFQKLLVRQVLNKSKLWSWRVTVGQCVINMCTQPWRDRVASIAL